MPFRIEIGIRYTDQDQIKGQYPAAGAVFSESIGSPIGATTYTNEETAEGLRESLEDHLQQVDAGFTVSQGSALTYTIAHASTAFKLNFESFRSLSDFLGFSPAAVTGTSTTGGQAPSIFESGRAAVVTTGWRWQLRRGDVNRGSSQSVKLLKQQIFNVHLQIERDQIKQWHRTQRYMLSGHPFSLYTEKDAGSVNGFNMNAYSQTNLGGRIYMQLDAQSIEIADQQLTQPFQSDIAVDFSAVAVSTSGGSLSIG